MQRPGARMSAALARSGDTYAASQLEERFARVREHDAIDERMGFVRLDQGEPRQAWLVNMHPTLLRDEHHPGGKSGVDYYFIEDDATMFKVTVVYQPYFLVGCYAGTESVVEEWLKRRFEGLVQSVERKEVDDLKLPNHLVGHKRTVLQLRFQNVHDLLTVRRDLLPLAEKAQREVSAIEAYATVLHDSSASGELPEYQVSLDGEMASAQTASAKHKRSGGRSPEQCISALYEYDVPYYLRVAIDNRTCVADVRYPCRSLVRCALPGRHRGAPPRAGACEACGPRCDGIRYRDYEAAAQVSRRRVGRGDDDFVHDRRTRFPHHEPRGDQRRH